MAMIIEFNSCFTALTNLSPPQTPYPWQQSLYEEFTQVRFRKTCYVPTGLGKTSVIAIWLLALAHRANIGKLDGYPRRLVYVVNRRTVVDQATDEVVRMRRALDEDIRLTSVTKALGTIRATALGKPLAISTLRGQFADNAEWRYDPSRPAVIIGTVDMIGSRLLFSGYGTGFKYRPLHAGFLGQDALLVHGETHLDPAFQELLEEITKMQSHEFMKLWVMSMTATMRSGGSSESPILTERDYNHPEAMKRLQAKKGLGFHAVEDDKLISAEIAKLASNYKDSNQAILIYAYKVEDVLDTVHRLRKLNLPVQALTGTLRGLERDNLTKKDAIFARFMPKSGHTTDTGIVYLACTSAGEVGTNISGDNMVCDLTTIDSMSQRSGRVNRFGEEESLIDVVYLNAENKNKSSFDQACKSTLPLLRTLPKRNDGRYDASPSALNNLLNNLSTKERLDAFTPLPTIPHASDILFDSWALTSVRQKIPGRPEVSDWLHGIAEWEPSETYIAWREEVAILTGSLLEKYNPEDLLEVYPIKPHELLRDRTSRVFKQLEAIARRCPDSKAWVVGPSGKVNVLSFEQIIKENEQGKPIENLADRLVVIPPRVGGLDDNGFLDAKSVFDEAKLKRYDVSDHLTDHANKPLRCRIWDSKETPVGMELVQRIDTRLDSEIDDEDTDQASNRRYWCWYTRPPSYDDGPQIDHHKQGLQRHLQLAEISARAIVNKLELNDVEAKAVTLAAKWHDIGKNRKVWQCSIGNLNYPDQVLAKSGGNMRPRDLGNFRHEFGSLLDVENLQEFQKLEPDIQDLVLHLIAAHHGRARPCFPFEEGFDPENRKGLAIKCAMEVPRRFARLQLKYGRWGLAYLESLLRAADALASQSGGSGAASEPLSRAANTGRSTMSRVNESFIRVPVNPENPGEFFACCGLLELASRRWPGAEAWFDGNIFSIATQEHDASLPKLLTLVKEIELVDEVSKALIAIKSPISLKLDWWKDKTLKTWAGRMDAREIFLAMCGAIDVSNKDPFEQGQVVYYSSESKREPFYFDGYRGANARPIDVGFSLDALKIKSTAYPVIEPEMQLSVFRTWKASFDLLSKKC
jgi:CRISPR-associated endonuclease/helicase Cas3